ncbi:MULTISPECIES: hypothetical protein [Phenylobacterium]|uniref:Uncharacterized protein n=1 Tax=Phenylobacterium koreense TaxID=266125 RepID=A0ABV2EF79_9CAUL
MVNPRRTHTNAADSAPGVDDGRATGRGPSLNSRPAGRLAVMWLVIAALIILAVAVLSRGQETAGTRLDTESTAPPATATTPPNPAAPAGY